METAENETIKVQFRFWTEFLMIDIGNIVRKRLMINFFSPFCLAEIT